MREHEILAATMRALAQQLSEGLTTATAHLHQTIGERLNLPLKQVPQPMIDIEHEAAGRIRGAEQLAERPADLVVAPPPRILHTINETREYGQRVWGRAIAQLTPAQRKLLGDYTAGSDGAINPALRGESKFSQSIRERVEQLDEIVRIQPVTERLQVWKSIQSGRLVPDRDLADIRPGDRGRFKDYVSTALYQDGINSVKYSRGRDTDLEVDVPIGTPAIYIGDLSWMNWEAELMLGRDLDFEFTKRPYRGDDNRWASAIRILPPGS